MKYSAADLYVALLRTPHHKTLLCTSSTPVRIIYSYPRNAFMKRRATAADTTERVIKKTRHLVQTPSDDVMDLTQEDGEKMEMVERSLMSDTAISSNAVADAAVLRREQDDEYAQALLIDQQHLLHQELQQQEQQVARIAAASSLSGAAAAPVSQQMFVPESHVALAASSAPLTLSSCTTPDVITVLAAVVHTQLVPASELVTFSFRSRATAWTVSFDAHTTCCHDVYQAVRDAFKFASSTSLRLRASQPPRELQDAVLPVDSAQTLAQWLPVGSGRRMRWFIETI